MRSPDRLVMNIPHLNNSDAKILGLKAQIYARRNAPKLTGMSASRIYSIYGAGFIGLTWKDPQVWYQNKGIRPFTMRSLQGKVIPMWIDDPTGVERRNNPKAKTRTTVSGKTQILIFRKATKVGQPGRINLREAPAPYTTPGKKAGAIAKGNNGLTWRHPGLANREFLEFGLQQACREMGFEPYAIRQEYSLGYNRPQTQTLADRMKARI